MECTYCAALISLVDGSGHLSPFKNLEHCLYYSAASTRRVGSAQGNINGVTAALAGAAAGGLHRVNVTSATGIAWVCLTDYTKFKFKGETSS